MLAAVSIRRRHCSAQIRRAQCNVRRIELVRQNVYRFDCAKLLAVVNWVNCREESEW